MLNDRGQAQKAVCCMISFISKPRKRPNYKDRKHISDSGLGGTLQGDGTVLDLDCSGLSCGHTTVYVCVNLQNGARRFLTKPDFAELSFHGRRQTVTKIRRALEPDFWSMRPFKPRDG